MIWLIRTVVVSACVAQTDDEEGYSSKHESLIVIHRIKQDKRELHTQILTQTRPDTNQRNTGNSWIQTKSPWIRNWGQTQLNICNITPPSRKARPCGVKCRRRWLRRRTRRWWWDRVTGNGRGMVTGGWQNPGSDDGRCPCNQTESIAVTTAHGGVEGEAKV